MAGFSIQRSIVHCNTVTALPRHQLRLEGKNYLILDEMSMLGQRTMAWVDKWLRQATGKLNLPLVRISIIIIGDFGQLPPLGGWPIYADMPRTVLVDHDHSIYTLFTTVVQHTDILRQSGANTEACSFKQLLLRLRDGQTTLDDWHQLEQRAPQKVNMENFQGRSPSIHRQRQCCKVQIRQTPCSWYTHCSCVCSSFWGRCQGQRGDRSVIYTKTWLDSRTTNARSSHNLYLCVIMSSGCVYIVARTVGDSH